MAKSTSIGITLSFQTPPSIAAAGAESSIIDRVVERNAKGDFIIPGSQLKGKLRHTCEQLLRSLGSRVCEPPRAETMCAEPPLCPVCRIFGSPAFPSPLHFHHLVLDVGDVEMDSLPPPSSLRTMIGVNRRRSTAAEKRLFFVETAPYFAELRFSNSKAITGALDSEAEVKLLLAGLSIIPAWGGMKSRGLGWVKQSEKDGCLKFGVEVSAVFNNKPVELNNWQEVKMLWKD